MTECPRYSIEIPLS